MRRLAGLFFLSGISGLIFQVIWFRRLALVFGVTSYALGIVLASYMAGLAIGSVAGGRLADRRRDLFRVYGLVEIAIAALGLSVLPLISLVQWLYVRVAPGLVDQPTLLSFLRFALSFAVMIPATACMGATLPVGVRAYNSRESHGVSVLYAANTAGAVVGVLAGGFVLLGVFGLTATSLVAAALNVACAAGAAALWRASKAQQTASPDAAPSAAATQPLSRAEVGVLASLFFAGFAALAYEVIWTRLFSVLAFEIVYGYAVMLAVLLAGVALGSALYGTRPVTVNRAVSHIVWLQMGIGVLAAALPLVLKPLANDTLTAGARSWPGIAGLVSRCPSCVSMLPGLLVVVFVSSALSGAAMPAAARVLTGGGQGWATRLGVGYAGNLVGGALGSLVAGFFLLPRFGAHASLLVVAFVNIAIGAGLALATRRRALAGAVVAGGLIAIAPSVLDTATLDVYRTVVSARLSTARIPWYREGLESSVAVAETADDRFLLINGAIHSASSGLYYHRWLGHLGAIAHPDPKDALVIGLGGGATAGAMALHPGLRVHVVELSEGVVEAARHMLTDDNYHLLSRQNVTRAVDDGRNHLLVSGRTYDIIEADIVEPRHAGASVLYSYEYFDSARRALKPGGIMVQWLGSPNSDAYRWTLNTFRRVFPYVSLWIGGGDVGIGSMTPLPPLDRRRLEQMFQDPALRQALIDARLDDVEKILAMKHADSTPPLPGPILTDDRPVLEYFVTLPFVTRRAFRR